MTDCSSVRMRREVRGESWRCPCRWPFSWPYFPFKCQRVNLRHLDLSYGFTNRLYAGLDICGGNCSLTFEVRLDRWAEETSWSLLGKEDQVRCVASPIVLFVSFVQRFMREVDHFTTGSSVLRRSGWACPCRNKNKDHAVTSNHRFVQIQPGIRSHSM